MAGYPPAYYSPFQIIIYEQTQATGFRLKPDTADHIL